MELNISTRVSVIMLVTQGPTKHRIGRIDRIGGTLSCIFLISLFPSPHSCDACLLYMYSLRG